MHSFSLYSSPPSSASCSQGLKEGKESFLLALIEAGADIEAADEKVLALLTNPNPNPSQSFTRPS